MSENKINFGEGVKLSYPAADTVDGKTGNEKVVDKSGSADALKEIDKNTVVLYIDVENTAGVEGGSIQLANKTAAGNYIGNVYYALNGSKVAVIVVDVANDILNVIK